MAAGPANFVGSMTIAANTAVGLFATTSADGSTANFTAGTVSLQGVPDDCGLCQVQSATSPSIETAYELPASGSFSVGGAEVFLYNPSSASITFTVRFASTA